MPEGLPTAGGQAVAMEATGSYWTLVGNILADQGMSIRSASRGFRGGRAMCAIPSGSRTCYAMGWSWRAMSRTGRKGSCANSPAIGRA